MKRPLALVALLLLSTPALADSLVVVESTLPAFAPGAMLDGDKPITLPEKSKLVLISDAGKTVSLSGPFSGKPGTGGKAADSRLTTALATLVRTSQEDANSVGAIRAASIKTRADALMVNLSESGDYCIADPKAVEMTRYADEKWPTVSVNAVKGDKVSDLSWPAGGNHAAWPEALPIEDGATYLVSQQGKDSRTMLVLHLIEDKAPTDAHRAVFMAEKGCLEQAKMLLALLKKG